MKKYLIYAPPYDELSGGAVCLHYLCHLLNENGFEASLVPFFSKSNVEPASAFEKIGAWIKERRRLNKSFLTYPQLNTPIIKNYETLAKSDDYCTVYPEVINGNPLGSRNIVRWLLHNPGFHTGNFNYGTGEIYFKFNNSLKDFNHKGSKLARQELKIIRYPLEHYNMEDVSQDRAGVAYCARKGASKVIADDVKGWTLIDNLSHAEVARILKRSKTFVSYDTLTAYSIFAVLCGCDSIVIPDQGLSEENWYPNYEDRYGIAYGTENLEKSRETQNLVLPRILNEHARNIENIFKFTQEVDQFFS